METQRIGADVIIIIIYSCGCVDARLSRRINNERDLNQLRLCADALIRRVDNYKLTYAPTNEAGAGVCASRNACSGRRKSVTRCSRVFRRRSRIESAQTVEMSDRREEASRENERILPPL